MHIIHPIWNDIHSKSINIFDAGVCLVVESHIFNIPFSMFESSYIIIISHNSSITAPECSHTM